MIEVAVNFEISIFYRFLRRSVFLPNGYLHGAIFKTYKIRLFQFESQHTQLAICYLDLIAQEDIADGDGGKIEELRSKLQSLIVASNCLRFPYLLSRCGQLSRILFSFFPIYTTRIRNSTEIRHFGAPSVFCLSFQGSLDFFNICMSFYIKHGTI